MTVQSSGCCPDAAKEQNDVMASPQKKYNVGGNGVDQIKLSVHLSFFRPFESPRS